MRLRPLEDIWLANPALRRVWDGWDQLQLPDCWLVAGCLAQTVWNDLFRLPPNHGISDIDIVYFDPLDLSAEAEAQNAGRIREAFADLPVWLDVKNEARVHLWYGARFGYEIAPYRSTTQAIASFPTTATALGIRPDGGGMGIQAPYGIDDLRTGTVRANKSQIRRGIYEAKVARWITQWPGLRVIGWDDADQPPGTPPA